MVAAGFLHPWKILRDRRHNCDNTYTPPGFRLPGLLLPPGLPLEHTPLRSRSTSKRLLFHHGWRRCDSHLLSFTRCQAHTCRMTHISLKIGWLFLFAVLMAAGLLFTMVFFVCIALAFHGVHLAAIPIADVHAHPPSHRSSCSQIWSATTLIL